MMISDNLLAGLPQPPRKVVLVRASRIGDFICATPAFRALRAALPAAEMTLIALPFVRQLVARSPHLDRFIPFPGFPGMAEQFFDARKALVFFRDMQAEQFDLAIQLHGSGVYSNTFVLMLGAKVTVGFVRPGDVQGRLDAALPLPEEGHEIDRLLALPMFLGAASQGRQTEFPLWKEDWQAAEALLTNVPRPLIGLHPGAREEHKRWPLERFVALAGGLRQRYGGTVVILGGPDEQELAAHVVHTMDPPPLNLAGRTSLPELGAVIAQLIILVANDSGPAHIAYALGIPSVTFFGATDPLRWGPPPALRHRVLVDHNAHPPHQSSCERITVPQALAAAEAAVQASPDQRQKFETENC